MRYRRLLAMFAFMCAASTHAADWPRYHGPDNNGISKETGLLKSWPEGGPKILWQKPLGIGYSSISVARGRVYTMYQDAQKQYVACFDEKTGNELWKAPTGPIFDAYDNHDGPRCTPTVDGDFVYALDGNGELVCLRAADGKVKWQENILKMAGAPNISWGMAQSPFIVGDKLILNPGGRECEFVALNKNDGKIVWKSGGGTAGYSTPVLATIGGVEQLVFFSGRQIAGVRLTDGKVLWTWPWKTGADVNAASPIVLGDMVFVSSDYNKGATVIRIDLAQPQPASQVWFNHNLECHFNTPILMDGCLYGYKGNNTGVLKCLDFKTGAQKWSDDDGEMPNKGQLTWADGLYYILGQRGDMALARLTPQGFQKLGTMKISPGNERWAPLAIANGKLFMRDDKQIYCLDIKAK